MRKIMRIKLALILGLTLGTVMLFALASFGAIINGQLYNLSESVLSTSGYSKPAKGASFNYTATGTTYTRVSDIGTDVPGDTIARPVYSRFPHKNCDGTLLFLQTNEGWRCGLIYNATSYALINQIPQNVVVDGASISFPSQESNEFRWDATRPNIMYCLQGATGYGGGLKFIEYDVLKQTGTVIHNFTSLQTAFPTAFLLLNDVEGQCSDNSRYWAWQVRDSSYGMLAIITYDKQLDVVIGTMTYATYQALGGKRSSLPTPNMVEISPLGDKVIYHMARSWDDRSYYPPNGLTYPDIGTVFDGPHAFDLNWTNPIKVAIDETHSGWAWDNNGNQMFISQNNRTDYLDATNIHTGAITQFKFHGDIGWAGMHFARMPQSCRNWSLISIYASVTPAGQWADAQIFMLNISSMNAGTWRIGPTFNTYTDYQNESFVPIDMSGTKIQSNAVWGTGNQDTYEIALPPNWMYDLNGSTGTYVEPPTDTTPPAVSNRNPASGATSVPINTNVAFTLSDSGVGVNISSVSFTVNGTVVFDGTTSPTMTVTGSPAQYLFTWNPLTNYSFGQVVPVIIDAKDLNGNAMAQVSYSFTVESSPGGEVGGIGMSLRGGSD
jgi:hypothetical protein